MTGRVAADDRHPTLTPTPTPNPNPNLNQDVWRPTVVTFINADGHKEDGEDNGGLTVEVV